MTSRKAHQRMIRERMAQLPEADLAQKTKLASDFSNAEVKEIDRRTASDIVLSYEWLGNTGSSEFYFGLYVGPYVAGVACFGRTGGTHASSSVCGKENAHLVMTLTRGACVHWAHEHSASFLINRACRLMVEKGFYIFIGYSDIEAGEVGTVYQASNWLYCGCTNRSEQFRWPGVPIEDDGGRSWKNGKWHDCRLISGYTRNRQDRRFLRELRRQGKTHFQGKEIRGSDRNIYLVNESRAELKGRMVAEGFEFRRGLSKLRYVHIAGDRRTIRRLRKALTWKPEEYPKRKGGLVEGNAVGSTDGGGVRSPGAAPVPPAAIVGACEIRDDRKKAVTVIDKPLAAPQDLEAAAKLVPDKKVGGWVGPWKTQYPWEIDSRIPSDKEETSSEKNDA